MLVSPLVSSKTVYLSFCLWSELLAVIEHAVARAIE